MTDIGIIFSGPMVRALLREVAAPGTGKTETRRLAWQPPRVFIKTGDAPAEPVLVASAWQRAKPGDRLWVRESFHATGGFSKPAEGDCAHLFGYEVPGTDREWIVPGIGRVREFAMHLGGWGGRSSRNFPSIHMPRWASRLTLTVTQVRRQRLQEITGADAKAEGAVMRWLKSAACAPRSVWEIGGSEDYSARAAFSLLWDRLHGASAWDANPEVVALTFTVALRNIDAREAA